MKVSAIGLSALGAQVAGTVDSVGPETNGFARGDRVAYPTARPTGADRAIVDQGELIGIPADVSLDAAACLFPCALLARTVVKQLHNVGRGDRVRVVDEPVVGPFLRAWAEHLGSTVVNEDADVVLTADDIRSARALRPSHGLRQQNAADVFAAIRSGAFDGIAVSSLDEARHGARTPVLLRPAEVTLAA